MSKEIELLSIIGQIEETKIKLYTLISEKKYDLLDSEVIKLSKLLDELLSQYYNLK